MLMSDMSETPLGPYIDHTNLQPDASAKDIERLCSEAVNHQMFAVCVNGCWVQHAWTHLAESDVTIATVIGFPLGASDSDSKRYETEVAVDNGAHEIDVVMNLGRFIDGDHRYITRELRDVIEAAEDRRVKVIIETGYFNDEQIATACKLAVDAGAQFPQTTITPRRRPSKLAESEDEIRTFLDSIPDYNDVFDRKTPEQVQVMLDEFLLTEEDAEEVSTESQRYSSDKSAVDTAFEELLAS